MNGYCCNICVFLTAVEAETTTMPAAMAMETTVDEWLYD
jgi:hypothetical protein